MEKPEAKIIGANSNIFNLLAIASEALKNAGQTSQAKEMFDRATKSESYEAAICIMLEYVDPVESDKPEQGGFSAF